MIDDVIGGYIRVPVACDLYMIVIVVCSVVDSGVISLGSNNAGTIPTNTALLTGRMTADRFVTRLWLPSSVQ